MKKSSLYTKKGDGGKAQTLSGLRVSKSHPILRAVGAMDELNAHLGVLRELLGDGEDGLLLKKVQNELFIIGSLLTAGSNGEAMKLPRPSEDLLSLVEERIDRLDSELSPLKNFILPSGSKAAVYAHLSRTVCRRAEREVAALEEESIPRVATALVNRLSDYFFVLARMLNKKEGIEDDRWAF